MARYTNYAPEFQVRINGAPVPAEMRACIGSVSYTDGMEGADRVELSLANPSLRWLDHPLLQPGTDFSLSMGYAPDLLEEVFVGEITSIEPSFPSGGMPTMRVAAQDFLQQLTRGTKDRAFEIGIPSIGNFPMPDPVVAAVVSATNGLIPRIDPIGGALSMLLALGSAFSFPQFSQQAVRTQQAETDFDFLTKIAKENGWAMFIDHTLEPKGYQLRFQFLMQDYSPSAALEWGASLIEFTPRFTTVGDLFGVSSRVWVESLGMEFVLVVGWDYEAASLKFSVYPGFGSLEAIIGDDEAKNTVAVKPTGYATAAYAMMAELLPRLNNRLTGSGSTIGNPAIKASRVIELKGLGAQFSGLWRITSATHTFDGGGYRTAFEVRKEVWFGSIPLPKSLPLTVPRPGAFRG
jgi:phage protein D